MNKKILLVGLVLVAFLCACNRKDFVNKIEGTWKLKNYIYARQTQTASFDTTNNSYQLVISSGNIYTESWKTYSFRADSAIVRDTLGYDSTTMAYHVVVDTLRYVDTTITPYLATGRWDLLNSEEDLQLRNSSGSDSSVRIFNILTLTTKSLNLLNGNKEYDLTK